MGQHLDDGDLSAVCVPDVGELHPNRPGPDDDHRLGHLAQHDGFPVGQHPLAIGGDAGDGSRPSASSNNDIARLQGACAALIQRHLDRTR